MSTATLSNVQEFMDLRVSEMDSVPERNNWYVLFFLTILDMDPGEMYWMDSHLCSEGYQ